MEVWYGGQRYFTWFLAFIHVLYIIKFVLLFFLSNQFRQPFYIKYFVMKFSIDVISTLFD